MNNLEKGFFAEANETDIRDNPNYYKGKIYDYVPDLWRAQERDAKEECVEDWWEYQYQMETSPQEKLNDELATKLVEVGAKVDFDAHWEQVADYNYEHMGYLDEYWFCDKGDFPSEAEVWDEKWEEDHEYMEYLDECVYDFAWFVMENYIDAIIFWANEGDYPGICSNQLTLDDVTEEIADFELLFEKDHDIWFGYHEAEPNWTVAKKDRQRGKRRKQTFHAKNHYKNILLNQHWNPDYDEVRYGHKLSEIYGKLPRFNRSKKVRRNPNISKKGSDYKRS